MSDVDSSVRFSEVVRHSFTDLEVIDMALSCVPLAVQIRIILNSVGFKFLDDGKPSLIVNLEPKPLTPMKCWRDEEKKVTYYEQVQHTRA